MILNINLKKFSQISAYSLKAQGLSGLKLCGGEEGEAKFIQFSTSGLLPIVSIVHDTPCHLIVFIVSKTRYNDNH